MVYPVRDIIVIAQTRIPGSTPIMELEQWECMLIVGDKRDWMVVKNVKDHKKVTCDSTAEEAIY